MPRTKRENQIINKYKTVVRTGDVLYTKDGYILRKPKKRFIITRVPKSFRRK